MKNWTRTGILLLLLVVPVLVFVFLKLFGTNHFTLPVYYATDSVQVGGKYTITHAHTIPYFNLLGQDGQKITSQRLLGNITIVDFIFTRCGSICPQMSTQLSRVQQVFSGDPDVKILSFTVDPAYDQPDTLKAYSKRYEADSTKWTFVTGSKDSIYSLAQNGFFITAMEDAGRPVDFIHSDKMILVDKSGWIRGYYNGTDKDEVDRLVQEVRVLQKIYRDE